MKHAHEHPHSTGEPSHTGSGHGYTARVGHTTAPEGTAHAAQPHGAAGEPEVSHTAHPPAGSGHGTVPVSWSTAAQATLHCLTGCAIGEVLGMVIGTAAGLSAGATVALAVALAFFFGYALTMRGVLRAGLSFREALRVALAADTVSILVMEIVDNTVMVGVPGAMEAGLASWLFWAALAFALAVAFVLTVPVNRWLIARGRGHAVVHAHHHH